MIPFSCGFGMRWFHIWCSRTKLVLMDLMEKLKSHPTTFKEKEFVTKHITKGTRYIPANFECACEHNNV
jgi:hypothetical protein